MARQAPPGSAVTGVPVPFVESLRSICTGASKWCSSVPARSQVIRTSTIDEPSWIVVGGIEAGAGLGSMRRTRKSCACGGAACQTFAGVVTVVAPSTDERIVGRLELTFFVVSGCSVDAPFSIVMLRRNGARLPAASCNQPVR